MARRVLVFGSLLVLLGAAFVIVSPALAEHLVFFPARSDPGPAPTLVSVRGRDVTLQAPDGVRLHAWWWDRGSEAPAVGVFHGNAGNIGGRVGLAEGLVRRGFSVLLLDYRGYGRSEGRPSEEGIYLDGQAAWDFLLDRVGTPDRVALMGRSLGGAVAIRTATERRVGALVVEAAFTSLDEMAGAAYPFLPSFLFTRLRNRFDNLARIPEVGAPVLVIHGENDDLVPPRMGRALFGAAPEPREWYPVEGAGHNDTFAVAGPAYFDRVADFLRRFVGPASG